MNFNLPGTEMFDYSPDPKQEQANPNGSSVNQMFQSPQSPQTFAQTDLAQLLQQHGIGTNNIGFNEFGRVQLLGRLRDTFGPNYMDRPETKKILDSFDTKLKNPSLDDQKAQTSMLSKAQRTVEALYR